MKSPRQFVPPILTIFLAALLALQLWSLRPKNQVENSDSSSKSSLESETFAKREMDFDVSEYVGITEYLEVIFNKPLFVETRRKNIEREYESEHVSSVQPEAPIELEVIKEPPSPPKRLLKGILASDGNMMGLLFDPETELETWVSIGDQVEGWRVEEIDSESIVFKNKTLKFIAKLYP